MSRPQFSSAVIVQKTEGTNVSSIDDVAVTDAEQTISFRADYINYLFNKGDYPILVTMLSGGSVIGTKKIENGYGFDNVYLTLDQIKVKTLEAGTTSLIDGMGVY